MDTTALTAPPTWTPTGSLNTRRFGHTATLLPSGKVLVAGGWRIDVGERQKSAELYDITTGAWSITGSLDSARAGHTATLLRNGKVLVVGGTDGGIPISELYDPSTGTWSPTGSPAFVYDRNTATLLPSGKVLIVWDVVWSDFEEPPAAELYDPATGTWGPAAMPTSFYAPGTATLLQDGNVLVGRGIYWYSDQIISASAAVYDPVSDSWRRVDDSICIDWSTATLLPNGKVLMAGGESFLRGTNLYDPAAEACFGTGDLVVARVSHTATLLPSGKVLAAGGWVDWFSYDILESAELYDPSTGIWSSASSLSAARWGHTATLLPDGRVLVAGGLGDTGVLNSAEIYDPVGNPANQPPVITQDPVDRSVAVGASASFAVVASGTPPLAYQWQRNGVDIPGATLATYTLAAAAAGDSGARFRCVVSNGFGSDISAEATLTVISNTPPTGTITSPPAGTLYQAGDTITYAGTGTDAEDGNGSNLPAGAFTWWVDFHHNDGTPHFHPFIPPPPTSGATAGSFVIPTSGETSPSVFYRIWLTVTDSGGLTHTSFRDVLPRTSTITLVTKPPGLSLTLDGQPYTGSMVGVAGMIRSIGAPTPQVLGGVRYTFRSWTDGGSATHNITTPTTNTTYTATFKRSTR